MFSRSLRRLVAMALCCAAASFAQAPTSRLNPLVAKVAEGVSEERIAATMKKLEGFGTRYVMSQKDNPTHGIGAAQRWIFDELKSYSPRLEVSYDDFTAKKSLRIPHDVDLSNIVAVLPGTINKDRYVIVSGHYDSIASRRAPGQPQPTGDQPPPPLDPETPAPGVADDASGVAAVMELARVMSQYEFDKSVVFIAFSAEETGLNGSTAYAQKAKARNMQIEAVLNNDIIGSEVAGNGRTANNRLRVFAEGPEDSPARALARYTKEIAERYLPSMTVDLVFRRDRFGRGGDHTPFVREGFAAVRLTTPSENYANQHSATDTFANASAPYTTRVARMNGAVLASLALAPKPPVVTRPPAPRRASGDEAAPTDAAAPVARGTGRVPPLLTRGKSGYDAALHWLAPDPEPDLAGYAVVIRATTSPVWEREIYVGNVTEYTIPDLSIDDIVIGVKAIDKDGNQSLVSAYEQAPFNPAAPPAGAPARSGGDR